MVYGVLGLINFAHSDVFMIGAYVGIFASAMASACRDLHARRVVARASPSRAHRRGDAGLAPCSG
jgi:branched-subunit amino acid ABC-type transport system permease component